jgi:hypothetical protein
MLREFLSGASSFDLPVIAMGIFVAMFAAVIVRVVQRSRAAEYRRMAALPLQDDVTGSNLP